MSNYPATLITAVQLQPRTNAVDPVVAEDINPVYEELIAVEAAVGVTPANYSPRSAGYTTAVATFGSLSERVGNLEQGFVTRVVDTIGGKTIQPTAANSTAVPLVVKQYSTSTANLLEFRLADGTLKTAVNSSGNIIAIDGGTA